MLGLLLAVPALAVFGMYRGIVDRLCAPEDLLHVAGEIAEVSPREHLYETCERGLEVGGQPNQVTIAPKPEDAVQRFPRVDARNGDLAVPHARRRRDAGSVRTLPSVRDLFPEVRRDLAAALLLDRFPERHGERPSMQARRDRPAHARLVPRCPVAVPIGIHQTERRREAARHREMKPEGIDRLSVVGREQIGRASCRERVSSPV